MVKNPNNCINFANSGLRTAADNAWAKILSGRFSTEKERQLRIMFSDTEHLERWSLTPLHKIVLGLLGRDLESELEVSTAEINTKDSNGRTALSFAAERSDILSMSLLLRYGADPGVYLPDQGSPLHFSATAIDTAGISILLEHGAAVDSLTSYSQTPLLYAAAYGSSRRHAELLLAAGADPNFKDRDGMTPLHWTAVSGNVEVATAILTHGGDADITDGHGDTVLSLSIRYNRHGIISALVSRKPNVTAEFAAGRTLLHIVAEAADLRTMNLLTRFDLSGIDVDTKGADRKTALEVFQDRQDAQEELEYAFGLLLDAEESGSDDGETTSEETWEDAVEFLDFL
jgi:ankyrin repeat protein